MTMIEKMARAMAAIYSKDSMISGDCDWEAEPNERDYEAAKAALTAMLEPTQTMTDAYFDLCDIGGDLLGDATLDTAFAAMIQAALDEPTTPPS